MSANSCDCLSKLIVFTLFIGIMAPSLAEPSAGGQRSLTGSGYSNNMFLIYLHLIIEPVLVEDNEL